MKIGRLARPIKAGFLAFVALGATSADSIADAIRYEYGGAITSADPSTGLLPGMRFSGSFTYDPSEPAAGMHYEGYHEYSFGRSDSWAGMGAPDGSGLRLDVGGNPVYSHQGGLNLTMTGDEPFIGYPRGTGTHVRIGNGGIDFQDPLLIALDLSNDDRVVYPTLAPPSILRLDDFRTAELSVTRLGGRGLPGATLYRGAIDILSLPSPAAEPSTLGLLAMGVAGWLGRSARRRSVRSVGRPGVSKQPSAVGR